MPAYTESQLLELTKVPTEDFTVIPKPAYMGFEINSDVVNVAAFVEIFKSKRQGAQFDAESNLSPLAQKEVRRVRLLRATPNTRLYDPSYIYRTYDGRTPLP